MPAIRRMAALLCCATVLLTPEAPARRQEAERSLTGTLAEDITIAFRDLLGYAAAPAGFDGADYSRLAAGAGGIAAVMAMDEPLNALLLRADPPSALSRPLDWAERYGKLREMQYAGLALYLGGLLTGSDDVRVTGRLLGESLMLAGLPAIALQYGLGRSRPEAGRGPWDYQYLEWRNERQSLPSGHTTVAFAVSTVLARRIDRPWAAVPLYAAAGLTAVSLTWRNQHWPSDVLIGAALGYLAGEYVVSREEERASAVPAGEAGEKGGDGRTARSPGTRYRFRAGISRGGLTLRYML